MNINIFFKYSKRWKELIISNSNNNNNYDNNIDKMNNYFLLLESIYIYFFSDFYFISNISKLTISQRLYNNLRLS